MKRRRMKFRAIPVLEGDWKGPSFRTARLDILRRRGFRVWGRHFLVLDRNGRRNVFYVVEDL